MTDITFNDKELALFDLGHIESIFGMHFENRAAAAQCYLEQKIDSAFSTSPYFDTDLYARINSHRTNLPVSNSDLLIHYLKSGRFSGISPHPLFDIDHIKKHADDFTRNNLHDAYLRFITGDLDISPHQLIDLDWIRSQPDTPLTVLDIFAALSDPHRPLDFSPCPLFDEKLYRIKYQERQYKNELIDYIVNRGCDGQTHVLFDSYYYMISSNTRGISTSALEHYLTNWEKWAGEPSIFVDLKHLNHQIGDDRLDKTEDPVSFSVRNRLSRVEPLFHPHCNTSILRRTALIADPSSHSDAEVLQSIFAQFYARAQDRVAVGELTSIIVLNFRKPVYTILSIVCAKLAYVGNKNEVVMIDNGGESFHFEYMHRVLGDCDGILLLKLPNNRYFGEGNNIGLDNARGAFVHFLNNDCFLPGQFGSKAMSIFSNNNRNIAALGALLTFPDGTIQEYGGLVNDDGQVVQRYKHSPAFVIGRLPEMEEVDYVSAACMLVRREVIDDLAGFDPTFEPFYYEDTDLCRRMKAQNYKVFVTRELTAIHIENASTKEYLKGSTFFEMIHSHRTLFARRWLHNLGAGAYPDGKVSSKRHSIEHARSGTGIGMSDNRPIAVIYTPFDIRPGGGERYLLSMAHSLSGTYSVFICSENYNSSARIRFTLSALSVPEFDFATCDLDYVLQMKNGIDVLVVMGNELVPPVPGIGRVNIFHLQFPFPWRNIGKFNFERLSSYDAIVVNSDFTASWTGKRIAEAKIPFNGKIHVINPPVKLMKSGPPRQGSFRVINVGRFFVGGHSKRQDVFLEIVRRAREISGVKIEAVLIGSAHSSPESKAYLEAVQATALAMGDVEIILEASNSEIEQALMKSDLYLHCAGFGIPEAVIPESAEHFGISVVEAIHAGCFPIVCDVGGPTEILHNAGVGFGYKSINEAAHKITQLLDREVISGLMTKANRKWINSTTDNDFNLRFERVVVEYSSRVASGSR